MKVEEECRKNEKGKLESYNICIREKGMYNNFFIIYIRKVFYLCLDNLRIAESILDYAFLNNNKV